MIYNTSYLERDGWLVRWSYDLSLIGIRGLIVYLPLLHTRMAVAVTSNYSLRPTSHPSWSVFIFDNLYSFLGYPIQDGLFLFLGNNYRVILYKMACFYF